MPTHRSLHPGRGHRARGRRDDAFVGVQRLVSALWRRDGNAMSARSVLAVLLALLLIAGPAVAAPRATRLHPPAAEGAQIARLFQRVTRDTVEARRLGAPSGRDVASRG